MLAGDVGKRDAPCQPARSLFSQGGHQERDQLRTARWAAPDHLVCMGRSIGSDKNTEGIDLPPKIDSMPRDSLIRARLRIPDSTQPRYDAGHCAINDFLDVRVRSLGLIHSLFPLHRVEAQCSQKCKHRFPQFLVAPMHNEYGVVFRFLFGREWTSNESILVWLVSVFSQSDL